MYVCIHVFVGGEMTWVLERWSQTELWFSNLVLGVLAKKKFKPRLKTIRENLFRMSQRQKWAIEEMN